MTKIKPKFVKSLAELKKLATPEDLEDWGDGFECGIALSGGLISSRKTIWYDPKKKKFIVMNHIDDTEQTLTDKQIMSQKYTNVGYAITKKALFYYPN